MSDIEKQLSKEVDLEASKDVTPRASSPESEELKNPGPEKPSKPIWIAVSISLFLGAFLYGLDTTIAADVQVSVYERFGEISKLAWVGTGFPLGSVAIILLVGSLFGQFEIKWLLTGFFLLFEIGSALCGAAPTSDVLIIGRVLAGMGGAGMYIGALTYISVFTSLKERPLYNAVTGLSWGIGAILGPVIGGSFAVNTSTTWRWAFYINLPLAGALAPSYVFLFPKFNPNPHMNNVRKLARLDWVGAFLNAAIFVLLVMALTFSGSSWAWSSPGSIVFWVLSGVSLIAFAVQQGFALFTSREMQLFPVHFLRSRTMVLLYLATAATSTAMGLCLYYTPLFFQFSRNDSALKAAVRLLPYIFPNVFGMMLSGALLPKLKWYAPWYTFSGILLLVAGCLQNQVTITTHTAAIYGFEVMTGFGAGMAFQIAYSVAASKLTGPDIARAIGFINVSQIGSMAIALAIAGTIFQNVGFNNLKSMLAGYGFPDAELKGALAGAESALATSKDPRVPQLLVEAVIKTIATDYILQIVGGALVVLTSLLMRWERIELDPTAVAGA